MNAAQRKQTSRPRIDATKALTLDERIEVLRDIFAQAGLAVGGLTPRDEKRVIAAIEDRGMMPMMFAHAWRVLLSESVAPQGWAVAEGGAV